MPVRPRPSFVAAIIMVWCAGASDARAQAPSRAQASSRPPRATVRAPLLTRPESTDYRETSRYADVMAFLGAVTAGQRRMHVTVLGYSGEGRALPLVVVGNVADASAEAVRRSGLLRVYIQANIHAGEVEGKEAALLLLRDLAAGRHERWLDSAVLLIAPIYNADGNERVTLGSRGAQNGPVGGVGQRPNAQNLDLIRDHMKPESPEARSLARFLLAYDPEVALDLHTTDGSVIAYQLTYAPPLHPGTDSGIVNFLRTAWLPDVTRTLHAREGLDVFYYGNLPEGPEGPRDVTERGWYSFDHRPRFNNNYLGLRNRFGILSEAYAYATFEQRIRATRRFVEEVVDFAVAHATRIRHIVTAADTSPLAGDSLPLRARLHRGDAPLDILIGAVGEDRNPYTGQRVLLRLDYQRLERMADWSTFEGVEYERVPLAYFLPGNLTAVLERLDAHGIRSARLGRTVTTTVERFRIDTTWTATRAFQGHQERTVLGGYVRVDATLGEGTVVVPTSQPLGRLIFYLLEPRSDDGLLDWNLFDDALLRNPRFYPVTRTFSPLP